MFGETNSVALPGCQRCVFERWIILLWLGDFAPVHDRFRAPRRKQKGLNDDAKTLRDEADARLGCCACSEFASARGFLYAYPGRVARSRRPTSYLGKALP